MIKGIVVNKILILIPNYLDRNDSSRQKLWNEGFELIENRDNLKTEIIDWDDATLASVDAVIAGVSRFGELEFQKMKNLKLLCKTGKGVDSINLKMAGKYGVIVTNTAGSNADAVAELAICFMIAANRNIISRHNKIKEGTWVKGVPGFELAGKTIGFLGFGDIAQRTAKRLMNFSVNCLAYDIFPNQKKALELAVKFVSLEQLLQNVDILSIHLPSLPETYKFLNRDKFALLKPGCKLINTSRGQVIDEDILLESLQNGIISFAALDTFHEEPLPQGSPFLKLDNVLLTPHFAGSTYESDFREIEIITNNLIHYRNGEMTKITRQLT
jgi:D-3-phosphoglycerate dehydrogenase / 2-oxoglutarate reductase